MRTSTPIAVVALAIASMFIIVASVSGETRAYGIHGSSIHMALPPGMSRIDLPE